VACSLLGCFLLGEKIFGMSLGWFLFLLPSTSRARRPAGSCYARKGRDDELLAVFGAGGRAWSCYKYRGLSLCRCALLWLGPANGGGWLLDLCFCSALTGVVHYWSVLDSLVRGVCRPLRWLSRTCAGVVGGALASWGPIVQLALKSALRTSGLVDQWWKVLPRRSRDETQATRGDNDRPQGQLACPVLLPVC
jgi:hypothetical protein